MGWCESCIDAETPLGRFISAQEFKTFKELCAVPQKSSRVADFAALRRFYDAAWSEILEEL